MNWFFRIRPADVTLVLVRSVHVMGAGVFLCCTPAVPAQAPGPVEMEVAQWLLDMETQLAATLDKDVIQGHQTAVATLDAQYLAAVEQALRVATAGSRLEDALTLQAEKERASAGKPMPPPADDAAIRPALARLRSTYRPALAKLEAARDMKCLPYYQRYVALLTAHQTDHTRKGNLNAAVLISRKAQSITPGSGLSLRGASTARVEAADAPMVKLEKGQQVFGAGPDVQWTEIPDALKDAKVSRPITRKNPTLKFKVLADGEVFLLCTNRWHNSGNGGPWQVETTSKEKFVEEGWKVRDDIKILDSFTLHLWEVRSRDCKAGEEFTYRTEKYVVPLVIVPD